MTNVDKYIVMKTKLANTIEVLKETCEEQHELIATLLTACKKSLVHIENMDYVNGNNAIIDILEEVIAKAKQK